MGIKNPSFCVDFKHTNMSLWQNASKKSYAQKNHNFAFKKIKKFLKFQVFGE
jgi:hypothetical protein